MNARTAMGNHGLKGPRTLLTLVLLAAACAGSQGGGGSPGTSPPVHSESLPALKLAVLDSVGGRLDYCDPDEHPIPRGAPAENARQRLPEIKKDREAFAAILEHERLSPDQQLTDDQLIAISDLYKQMQAIRLQPTGNGYLFNVTVQSASKSGSETVVGAVSPSGVVRIEARRPGKAPMCPICLAAGVRISTPSGGVPVEEVALGMAVWTTDTLGRRMIGIVLSTGRAHAPNGHRVVRLTLLDGRSVLASPGHPTMDGPTVGALRAGDRFDGSVVVSAIAIAYAGAITYDIRPSGPTGSYFANGVLLGSTLTSAQPVSYLLPSFS